MTVAPQQRHSKRSPCEICGGWDDRSGRVDRCWGFTSEDGVFCYCSRAEYATADSPYNEKARAYQHRLKQEPRRVSMRRPERATEARPEDQGKVVAEYIYENAAGNPHMKVIRYHPKTFRQARWTGEQWVLGIADIPLYPYHLSEIVNADANDAILIVEGEKDVETLRELGFIATCSPMGAGKWRDEYNQWFRDRFVLILPDNDEPGHKHAQEIRKALRGIARQVAIVPMAMGIPKGDVTDWLAEGHSDSELEELLRDSLRLAQKAKTNIVGPLTDIQLAQMEFPPIQWVIPEVVPEGLTLLGGKAKMGKSWMVLAMCIAVANGAEVFGDRRAMLGDVLYLALEDNWRRLNARTKQLYRNGLEPTGRLTFDIMLPRLSDGGLSYIERWCEQHPDRRLIVVDTLAKVRDAAQGKNSSGFQDDYASLQGLKEIADAYSVAIVVIHHLRKMDSEDPMDLFNGTMGLMGAADHLMVLKRQRSENDGVLHIVGREGPDLELALGWNVETTTWRILGDASAYALTKERQQIVDYLHEEGVPRTPKEVAEGLEKNYNTVKNLILKMDQAGILYSSAGKYFPTSISRSLVVSPPTEPVVARENPRLHPHSLAVVSRSLNGHAQTTETTETTRLHETTPDYGNAPMKGVTLHEPREIRPPDRSRKAQDERIRADLERQKRHDGE